MPKSTMRRQHTSAVMRAVSATLLVAGFAASARAEDTIVLADYGGALHKAFEEALVTPSAAKLGVSIREELHDDLPSVRVQVQSGAPAWDIVHLGGDECARGEREGLFEPLASPGLDLSGIPESARSSSWVATNYYSVVLAWRTDKFPKEHPTTWADFWDVKRFPGSRAIGGAAQETLEIALLADGVPKDKLYPLDVDRALKAIDKIKPNVNVFWNTGAQSTQLIKDGEVDLIAIYGSRVLPVIADGNAVQFTYNEGILGYGCVAVLKGARNAEKAKALVALMVSPAMQANIPETMPYYGPVNAKAFQVKTFPPETLAKSDASPENIKKQVLIDTHWWAINGTKAEERFKSQIVQ